MNPSITQLALIGVDQDQSAPQSGSKTIKKKMKGKNIFDLIGGVGSFASIMKQKGALVSGQKSGNDKEGSINSQDESICGKDEIKSGFPGIKVGKGSLLKSGEETAGGKSLPLNGKTSHDNDLKNFSEASSSKRALDGKTKGEIPAKVSDKAPVLGLEESVEHVNTLNMMTGSLNGDSPVIKSVAEQDNKLPLRRNISGLNNVQRPASGDAIVKDGGTDSESAVLLTGNMKGNEFMKKSGSEGMKVPLSGDEMKDHRYDDDAKLSKSFDSKGMSISAQSSDSKEHEMSSSKNLVRQLEGIKDHAVSDEKTENFKVLAFDGLQPEKSYEKGLSENLSGKTDPSLLNAQVDSSTVKVIGNSSEANVRSETAAPLQYQNVADQIMEDASYMVKKGGGRVVITLEPPNLGTLNMDVRVQHDTVKMFLIADNQDVKQILHSNIDQLKTALQDQGLKVDRVDVLVQDKSYDSNPGFQPGGGAQFEEGRGRREDAKEDNPSQQALTSEGSEMNESHLGMISLFA